MQHGSYCKGDRTQATSDERVSVRALHAKMDYLTNFFSRIKILPLFQTMFLGTNVITHNTLIAINLVVDPEVHEYETTGTDRDWDLSDTS
jgi:hypothetical protein